MKRLTVCLLILCMLLGTAVSCAPTDTEGPGTPSATAGENPTETPTEKPTEEPTEEPTEASTEPEPEPEPELLEGFDATTLIWSMDSLPFAKLTEDNRRTAALAGGYWDSRSGGAKVNEAWSFESVYNGGYRDSGCLRVNQLTADWRYDVILYLPDGTRTDWIGADELWLYVDFSGSGFKSQTVNFDLGFIDAHGDLYALSRDTEEQTPRGCVYTTDGLTWASKTLNAWGHFTLPSNYCGYIRVPIDTANYCNVKDDAGQVKTPDLSDVAGITLYFENYTDKTGVFFVDGLRIHIDEEKRAREMETMVDTLTLDKNTVYQTVEYIGGSGCWVGKVAEYLSEAQLRDCMELLYNPVTGIGLTSYRYNIGAGMPMNTSGESVKSTVCVRTAAGVYDLALDQKAIEVMDYAIANGCDCVTLFVNSPPADMTVSGYTCGDMVNGNSNLKKDCYQAFADYVADVTALFINAGYPVRYVSPINEPSNHWGRSDVNQWQEGCFYTPEEIIEVELLVAKALEKKNLSVKVALPELAGWSDWCYAQEMVRLLAGSPELLAYTDHFCAHSYNVTDAVRNAFMQALNAQPALAGLQLRQSEWCSGTTGFDAALELAEVMHGDLTQLNVVSWEFWVNMMTDEYSLIRVDNGSYTVSKRLYALGNYAKFIQGATRVKVTESNADGNLLVSAYENAVKGETYLVVVNKSNRNAFISLEGADGKTVTAYETSKSCDLACTGNAELGAGATVPAKSVVTFVIK